MFKKLLTLVLAVFILSPAPVTAAAPDPASAAEWRRAEMLLLNRKASEAYPIFSSLLQRYPGHSSLMLGMA
ncbi:MAG: hypothetical protein LBP22_17560, partial [Deltaproteobacteria bacterium]|nr:hypothetical protein [Deltaproteobacteria bacterium]